MPILCLLADHLPIQVEQQRRHAELPLLITHPVDPGLIFACSPEALAAGVQPGLSVYQARQMLPQALLLPPDEHAYHASHGALEAALRAYSPLLETVGLGEFLLDARALIQRSQEPRNRLLGSLPHGPGPWGPGDRGTAQHGGDDALTAALVTAAQAASGLMVRVGLGAGRFVAEQAARQAPANSALVVPPGGEARFLAPLPVDVLPNLPPEARRRLDLFDLHTLGDLVALRKPAVLRQFGAEMAGLYELARGRDPRPLHPDVPPLRLVRSLRLTSPVSDRHILLNAAQRVAWRLSKVLNHKGYHAEALKLTLYQEDGAVLETGQAAKPPTSDEARLGRLAAQLLGRLTPRAPVAAVALSVYPLRPWHLSAHQIDLLRAGVPEKELRFESALQLLYHRFGQAIIRVAALLGPPVPLPIDVDLDPAGQPLRLAFGGLVRAVVSIHERWREEKQWWDEARALRRDYYRVTLADDTYRNIYQDLNDERWYLDRAWPVL